MKYTDAVPNVPISSYKRTKIVATLGPSTDSYELVREIIKNGANALRLNFSHGTHEEHGKRIEWIRKASAELGKPVAIIQDLQGPKVRLGDFEGIINVLPGQELRFKYNADHDETEYIPTQYDLSKKVKRGERLYLYDGKVRTIITSVKNGVVYARADNEGILIKRKGMNLPDTDFGGDIITAKDRADLAYGSTQDIDYVALSFVQTADDINDLRKRLKSLGSQVHIIAKIETKAATQPENLDAIMQATDAAMIARGDLAVETPAESVPIVQRQIIGLGMRYGKPTIVATQMLASMTDMPEPTRAEVSDVATAVFLGADAVMLSDETASGKYPLDAVQFMKRIIRYSETNRLTAVSYPDYEDHSRQGSISRAIISLADSIQAKAIVAETKTGATARQIATRRPCIPIIAVASDVRTAQQLALVYNVKSYQRPVDAQAADKLTKWLATNKALNKGEIVVTVSGQYPGLAGATDTIKVRVIE
jgi:pyruvate kinase